MDQLAEGKNASLGPVQRYDTLADRAYEQLRLALMTGSFHPGQKLTIRKLAAILGVSATPARDAISRLISEKVLESDANRNVFAPRLDAQRLQELYLLRRSLEGPATELGAANINDEDIKRLEQIQISLIAAMDRQDYQKVLIENERFHFGIYEASGNRMLIEMIQQLWLKLGPTLNFLYPSYNSSRKGIAHHVHLIEALRAGDHADARRAIEDDLRDGEKELCNALAALAEQEAKTPKPRRRRAS